MSANLISLTSAGGFSTTGNVVAGNIFGNGSQLTGIVASPSSNILNGNSNVSIATGNGNVTVTSNGTNTWNFDTTGNLIIPSSSGGLIKTEANGAIAIAAMNNGTDNPAQLMSWRTTENNPDTIVSTYANSATVMTNVTGTLNTWTFDNTGNLTLPGNMIVNGNINTLGTQTALLQPIDDLPLSFIATGANGSITSFWAEDFANLMTSNIAAVYTPLQNSQTVRIVTGNNGGNIAIYDFDQLGMFTTTDVCATGNIHAGNLILNSSIIGTGASPAPSLSGFSSVSAISLSASGNITGNKFIGNGALLTNVVQALIKPNNLLYVAKNGSDITGTGSINAPYQTVQTAIDAAAGDTATTIILAPGSYVENLTIANVANSLNITGSGLAESAINGNIVISGTSDNIEFDNFRVSTGRITHSATGYWSVLNMRFSANTGITKTSTSTIKIFNTDLGASGTGNILLQGGKTNIYSSQIFNVQISGANTEVNFLQCDTVILPTVISGNVNFFDTNIVSSGSGNSLNAISGYVTLKNCLSITPSRTLAPIGFGAGASYSYGDSAFDVGNSTFAGTAIVQQSQFQAINVRGGNITSNGLVSVTGNITGGNILTSGRISATGNITGNFFIGDGSQLTNVNAATVDVTNTNGLTTVYYPTFVENRTTAQIARADVDLTYRTDDNLLTVGNVSITGNITTGNLLTAGLISATGNITAAGTGTNMVRRAYTVAGSNTKVTLDNITAQVGGTPTRLYIGTATSNLTVAGDSQTLTSGSTAVSSWINVPIVTGTGNEFAMSGALTNNGDTAILSMIDQGTGTGMWRITGMIANTTANLYGITIERLA